MGYPMKIAKPVLGVTGLIEIDRWRVDPTTGLIYGLRGRAVGSLDGLGYLQVDGRSRGAGIRSSHGLVWRAVHGPIRGGLEINHINGIKTDNRIANLELVTRQENVKHAFRIGLKSTQGEKHPQARLNDEAVRSIRRNYAAGVSIDALATQHGMHRRTINDVVIGKAWTHVKEVA